MKQVKVTDLIKQAGDVLLELGASPEQMDMYYGNNDIKITSRLPLPYHRPVLNGFWVVQLSSIQADTMNARFSLINDGSDEDWLRLFKAHVAPVIILYGLPVGIY